MSIPTHVWDNTITSYSMGEQCNPCPSIGSHTGDNVATLVWNCNNYVYSAWTNRIYSYGPYLLASNADANTETNVTAQSPGFMMGLWRRNDGFIPITWNGIQHEEDEMYVARPKGEEEPRLLKGGGASTLAATKDSTVVFVDTLAALPTRWNKHGLVNLQNVPGLDSSTSKGLICFEIAYMAKGDGQALDQLAYVDKDSVSLSLLPLSKRTSLRSARFTVDDKTKKFSLAAAYYAKGLSISEQASELRQLNLFSVSLKEVRTESVVRDLWTIPASRLLKSRRATDGIFKTLQADLVDLKGKQLYLSVDMIGKDKDVEPLIVNDYLLENARMQKLFKRSSEIEVANIVHEYELHQNYPNPANPSTTIGFDLVEPQNVMVKIYNSLGQEVQMITNDFYPAGSHDLFVDVSSLASGIYFYRIQAGKFIASKKLIVLK